jgi:hypothetical protein
VSRALSWKPLCALGLISYGVYLWHWPVYVFLDADRVHLTGWPLLAVQITVTIAVSYASYRLVERPIRHGAGSTRVLVRLTPAVAVALVAVILLATTNPTSQPIANAATSERGRVLVVGDSVAHSLTAGLENAGFDVEEATAPACHIVRGKIDFDGPVEGPCPWPRWWKDKVEHVRPEAVVLISGAWDLFDVKPRHEKAFLVPGTPAWAKYYASELEAVIDVLGSTGSRVVIPTIPVSSPQGYMLGSGSRSFFDPGRVRAANAVIKQVAARNHNVVVPDLYGLLSPDGVYRRNLGEVAVARADGVHFTAAGARAVGNWLATYLGPVAASSPGNVASPGRVFIVGDSVAHSLRPALDRAGYQTVEWWAPACRLLDGHIHSQKYDVTCPWRKEWAGIPSTDRDTVILVIGAWDLFDLKPPGSDTWLQPGSKEWNERYAATLQDAVRILGQFGARVVMPNLPCYKVLRGTPDFGDASATNVERVRAADRIITDTFSHDTSVAIPDLFKFLCPSGAYQDDVDGVARVRQDGMHFSDDGGDLVVSWLRENGWLD